MSIDKVTAEFTPTNPARQGGAQPGTRVPRRFLEPLRLQMEDDAGGDPYNRTGQHCLADLKKKKP